MGRTASVLIKQKMLSGNVTKLIRANVLSEKDGMLRVMVEGQRKPIEVKASDTLPAEKVFGVAKVGQKPSSVLQRCYPSSINSLGNTLNR